MLKPYFQDRLIEAGLDEAGRGCLAGPVFSAAVILPKDYHNTLLNDSKKLSEKKRDILRGQIEKEAIAYAVKSLDNHIIDQINIYQASYKAMHLAVAELSENPELLLVDGNRFIPLDGYQHQCIVKGDGKYLSIAAASILAKTYRDEYMYKIHKEFPEYGWDRNKGYATKMHQEALLKYGQTHYHRKTFHLKNQNKLDL